MTNAELRSPYEKAVLHRSPEYEDVVWSTADGEDLIRSTRDMYESYEQIVKKRQGRPIIDNDKYSEIVRKLRDPNLGRVLQPIDGRKGLYTYSEKMLRGFVRMQAEANGVELTGEKAAPRQHMYVGNSRTGSYGSSIPRGVDQNRTIGGDDEELPKQCIARGTPIYDLGVRARIADDRGQICVRRFLAPGIYTRPCARSGRLSPRHRDLSPLPGGSCTRCVATMD